MENVTRVTLPLSFSGESSPRRPALGSYSTVIRGQVIGLPEDEQDTPVLASVTGVLSGTQTLIHPLYGELECAVLDCMVSARPEPLPRPHKGGMDAGGDCGSRPHGRHH